MSIFLNTLRYQDMILGTGEIFNCLWNKKVLFS